VTNTSTTATCRAVVLAAALGTAGAAIVTTLATRALRRHLKAARAEAAAWRADALHDALTGLPNRRAAIAEVDSRLAHGGRFLLALVDLDRFKTVNDTYGHPAGDHLLAVIAARLHVAIPPDGFAARLGGDEFLVLLTDDGTDPAAAITPVLQLLTQPVRIGTATLRPHACAGVAATDPPTTWRRLIANADQALYHAKSTAAGVAVYSPHLDTVTTDDTTRRHRTT
jgi:diguanylate cyclase (GGDEF)-like protein